MEILSFFHAWQNFKQMHETICKLLTSTAIAAFQSAAIHILSEGVSSLLPAGSRFYMYSPKISSHVYTTDTRDLTTTVFHLRQTSISYYIDVSYKILKHLC